jgi:uncharacterized protein YdeI (YjbR/CyaY-like superfamily)
MNPKVDAFLSKAKKWPEEFKALRKILFGFPLTEELKWYQPCYTFQNNNVVLIGGFKDYCVLLFFKGALLKDNQGILVRPGEHTQAGRQIRFTNLRDIQKMEPVVRTYIQEAIEAEKAGLNVKLKKKLEPLPTEFKNKLDELPALKKAFYVLTPGRQRAYILYFSAAKQSGTRESRIEKYRRQILGGKGLND